jgi:pimeloyl-ACP methyl ester carboxylesterase
MFMLSVPELEAHLSGMALVSSAPHAGWRTIFTAYVRAHSLPEVDKAAERYAEHPSDETLRTLTLAAAPWSWNSGTGAVARGRALLARLPYNHQAAAWANAHFDAFYRARWTPRRIPTLIVGGTDDVVVDQQLWQDEPKFIRPNILQRRIEGAGHFPWTDTPSAIEAAFADLTLQLDSACALH